MTRRVFLAAGAVSMAFAATRREPMPLGFNTYCLRSMGWDDATVLQYAADHELDAIFLQGSQRPARNGPRSLAPSEGPRPDLGLHLETGGGAVLPRTADEFSSKVETLRTHITRAKALGSPLVRCLIASNRASLPPGTYRKTHRDDGAVAQDGSLAGA